jgi:hypothetical protein
MPNPWRMCRPQVRPRERLLRCAAPLIVRPGAGTSLMVASSTLAAQPSVSPVQLMTGAVAVPSTVRELTVAVVSAISTEPTSEEWKLASFTTARVMATGTWTPSALFARSTQSRSKTPL